MTTVDAPLTRGEPERATPPGPARGESASALYAGTIRHRRFGAVRHEFDQPIVMTLLDLGEAGPLLDRLPLWSRRRWAPVRFRRRDYLDGTDAPLRAALDELVEARTGRRLRGPVRMLTHLRTWGWLFNPITVYWCFEADGITPDLVVLEVTNTPWGERQWYVVAAEDAAGRGAVFPKSLHVSPFLGMDLDYRLSFTAPVAAPRSRLELRLEVLRSGRKVFDADLSLTRTELTPTSAVTVLVRHPVQTVRVSLGIYAQAARLWTRRVPLVSHPRRTDSRPEGHR